MNVKYLPSDWEKIKDGIGDLIGDWAWGDGVFDPLKDICENLEDAKSEIADYDHDGVISFHYTSQKNKYDKLLEDFEILHGFTGKVGDIVDRTIDQPFYEDMDAFVEAMRDLTISNYKTQNRIGATETQIVYAGGYGPQQFMEVPKKEVSLDDLLSGGNFYGDQMKLEFEEWKKLNPDKDISEEEYRQGALNTRAFEYESIRNKQESKEFWVQLGALVVIVGATIICPPAGLALGAAYGALELGSAVSGKDWVSGRELGTGERWFRGLLAPLDIVPGVNGLSKFSSTVRLAHMGEDVGKMGLKMGVKGSLKQGMTHIDNMIKTAGQQTAVRLKSASSAVKDVSNLVKKKLAKDIIEVGKLTDSAITAVKNNNPFRHLNLEPEYAGIGKVDGAVQNTHAVENKLKDIINRMEVNLGGSPRATGNTGVNEAKTLVGKGEQFTNGRKNKLKPDIRYQTGEFDYFYETDSSGRLTKFETDDLQLTTREDRLSHSKNTPGKIKGKDHAGHLAGDRFGGSPKIDNLVSQLSEVNLSQYKKIENLLEAAIRDRQKVTVNVDIIYEGSSSRPSKFIVKYTIDGEAFSVPINN